MFSTRIFKTVLAMLLLLTLTLGMVSCGTKPSEEAFKSAYDKVLEGVLGSVDKYYAEFEEYDLNNLGMDATMGITLSDEFNAALGNVLPINLSFINDLKLNVSESIKGDKISANFGLIYGETELLDAGIIADMAANTVFLGIPVLNEAFVQLDGEDVDFNLNLNSDIFSILPTKDSVKNLINGVYNVMMDNIGEVTFVETELTVNGITQKCVEYTVELSEKEAAAETVKLLRHLETDENLKNIVVCFVNYYNIVSGADADSELYFDPDEAYAEVVEYIREGISELEAGGYSDETALIWKSYITDKQNIIGIKLDLIDVESGDAEILYIGTAGDKKNTGIEIYATDLGVKVLEINGKTVLDGKTLSGSFEVKTEGEDVTVLSFENVDAAKLLEGQFNGTVKVSLSEANVNFGEYNLEIEDPSLKIDIVSSSEKENKMTFGLYDGDKLLASAAYEIRISEGKDITVPENVMTDVDLWAEGISFNKLVENATNSGLPDYIVSIISLLAFYA